MRRAGVHALVAMVIVSVMCPGAIGAQAVERIPQPAPLPSRWDSHWGADALGTLLNLAFLTEEDTRLDPDGPLPRGKIATWIAQVAGLAPFRALRPTFRDLPADGPTTRWVGAMVQAGAINGYPDGTFRPERSITRAEVAKVFSHFGHRFPVRRERVSFRDIEGHWANEHIMEAARRDILTGYADGTFRPDEPITVAEGATMVFRLLVGASVPSNAALRLSEWLGHARRRPGLVTVGEMGLVFAQNYFAAPPETDEQAALAILRRQDIPVDQSAHDYLSPEELTAWVTALRRQGRLDELTLLDRHPEIQPSLFVVDLQIVRDALTGTLLTRKELVYPELGACFAAIGMGPHSAGQQVSGISHEAALALHPSPANHAPVAAFAVISPVRVGQPVTYTDLSFDPDGDPLRRLWAGKQEHFEVPGTYLVTLTVVDPGGLSATVTKEVEVQALANQPPVARFDAPGWVLAGERVRYVDRSTDPDGDPLIREEWTGRQDRFESPGRHKVTLRVQDGHGLWSAPYSRTITVVGTTGQPAEIRVSPNPVQRGEDVTVSIGCPETAYQVWVDVPSALEHGTVRFGDGQILQVDNPDGWANQAGFTWSKRLNVPWTENSPPDGVYPVVFTVFHKKRISWEHTHEREVCDPPAEDGEEPVCRIETYEHAHWETIEWTTSHTADVAVRGTRRLVSPGRTEP